MFGLVLGGELLLPLLEEISMLAFEWAHKTLDVLYADVFGLEDEDSQKASAWTGLFLLVALIGWVGYKLYLAYQRAKAAAPLWWAGRKADLHAWWTQLPWYLKLAHLAGGLAMLAILAMFI